MADKKNSPEVLATAEKLSVVEEDLVQLGIPEGFRVHNQDSANWVVRKINEARGYTYTDTSQSVIPFVFRQTADRLKGSICDVSFIEKKL